MWHRTGCSGRVLHAMGHQLDEHIAICVLETTQNAAPERRADNGNWQRRHVGNARLLGLSTAESHTPTTHPYDIVIGDELA